METTAVVFSLDELWLLRAYIRHEVPQMETWKWPPASLELNDQIAETLLMCHEDEQQEAALLLTRADCLAIDACVPQDAKDANGVLIGKSVLLKTFAARRDLADGPIATVAEPPKRAAYWLARQDRSKGAQNADTYTDAYNDTDD